MIETPDNLNSQAIQLASEGLYPEAIACIKRAITISKDDYRLWYNLGITYRDSDNLEGACDALIKALQINNNDVEVYEALSHVLFLQQEYDYALNILEDAIDFFPDNPCLWNNYGVVLFNKKEYDNAAEAFECAVCIYPYYYDALYNLKDTYDILGNQVGKDECEKKLKNIQNNQGTFYA